MRPGRAADHSPPSNAAVMEEQSYTSTHPLGHIGPVTGSPILMMFHCVCLCVWYDLRVIKLRRMRWARHVARMGEERGCIGSCWGNRREGDHWGDLRVDVWIILGWICSRWDVGIWSGLGWPRIETGGGRL